MTGLSFLAESGRACHRKYIKDLLAGVPRDEICLKYKIKDNTLYKAVWDTARPFVEKKTITRGDVNNLLGGTVVVEGLPDGDISFTERHELRKRRNRKRIAHKRAHNWQKVKLDVTGPYGICFFGDPHLDDPYCDISGIERDAQTCAETPAMYAVNGGDSINNWVGRLERLYGEQDTTVSEGWQYVDWFLNKLGINWLLWILGNHDVWNNGQAIFEAMNAQGVLMRDWDAKIIVQTPDGDCKLWVRHDFKGQSIYNELHGQKRAAMFGGGADIFAAFHRHNWGIAQGELDNGKDFTLIRARGYKECDDYALKGGFAEQLRGQSIVTIVEPRKKEQPIVHAFNDVQQAADFLNFLRSK